MTTLERLEQLTRDYTCNIEEAKYIYTHTMLRLIEEIPYLDSEVYDG